MTKYEEGATKLNKVPNISKLAIRKRQTINMNRARDDKEFFDYSKTFSKNNSGEEISYDKMDRIDPNPSTKNRNKLKMI